MILNLVHGNTQLTTLIPFDHKLCSPGNITLTRLSLVNYSMPKKGTIASRFLWTCVTLFFRSFFFHMLLYLHVVSLPNRPLGYGFASDSNICAHAKLQMHPYGVAIASKTHLCQKHWLPTKLYPVMSSNPGKYHSILLYLASFKVFLPERENKNWYQHQQLSRESTRKERSNHNMITKGSRQD